MARCWVICSLSLGVRLGDCLWSLARRRNGTYIYRPTLFSFFLSIFLSFFPSLSSWPGSSSSSRVGVPPSWRPHVLRKVSRLHPSRRAWGRFRGQGCMAVCPIQAPGRTVPGRAKMVVPDGGKSTRFLEGLPGEDPSRASCPFPPAPAPDHPWSCADDVGELKGARTNVRPVPNRTFPKARIKRRTG